MTAWHLFPYEIPTSASTHFTWVTLFLPTLNLMEFFFLWRTNKHSIVSMARNTSNKNTLNKWVWLQGSRKMGCIASERKFQPIQPSKPHSSTHPVLTAFTQVTQYVRQVRSWHRWCNHSHCLNQVLWKERLIPCLVFQKISAGNWNQWVSKADYTFLWVFYHDTVSSS